MVRAKEGVAEVEVARVSMGVDCEVDKGVMVVVLGGDAMVDGDGRVKVVGVVSLAPGGVGRGEVRRGEGAGSPKKR